MNAKEKKAQTKDLIARIGTLKTPTDNIQNARFREDGMGDSARNPFRLISEAVDIMIEGGFEGIRGDLVGGVLKSGIPIAAVQVVDECLDAALELLHDRR